MKKALLVTAMLLGCGGEDAAPPKTTASAASSAAPAASVPAADCYAGLVTETPAGWVPGGKIVVALDGENPKHVDAFDAAGKATLSTDVSGNGRATHDAMSKAICSTGALGAIAPTTKPSGGSITLVLVKPTSVDPAGDVALMCGAAPPMPADVDPSQAMRVAAASYEERLASPKWRNWLRNMSAELVAASDAPAMIAIKKKRGDELDAAAAKKPCWFADALHGKI